ncbi:putative DNA helicase [Candidatus Hydrogenisulfobacillus filiaventi]|uniref:DNA 3'-5' helicase n=1 Tax=Candidatus Hydrogenisulfobacillus filiaventi TaxID=2707344 RepID=A0A6F8ZJT8_9FIRM|nr:putative DNA helicase [Candidatus Hydrogenisulfobacillus filiaventi]
MGIDDAAARRLASGDFRRSWTVEAGAGTGKTTLLVERVLTAVLREGIPLEQVVLITFMEEAAYEILERLEARLAALEAAGGADPGRLARVRAALPAAPITTIHGLAARILRDFALEAGISPGFQVLDARAEAERFEEAWQAWLASATGERQEVLGVLLALGVKPAELQASARAAERGGRLPPLGPDPAPAVDAYLAAWRIRQRQLAQAAALAADADEPGRRQLEEWGRWLERAAEMPVPDRWRVFLRPISWAPKGSRRRWRDPAALDRQKAALREAAEGYAVLASELAAWWAGRWLRLLDGDWRPFWRRARLQAGVLHFDDLLRECRDLLAGQPAVRRALAARWRLIMVDEFQDTDPVQAEIVFRLAGDPAAEDWRRAPIPPGRLFVVGDPQQSIYRFRQADVETYIDLAGELETRAEAGRLAITRNFRSAGGILELVNTLMPTLLAGTGSAAPYRPLEASHPDRRPRPAVALGGTVPGTVREARLEEARQAAAWLTRAVREGWPVRSPEGERPLTWGDCALVVPQRTGLSLYREVFSQAGIPLASEGGNAFFRQDEVRGAILFLRAVWDPDDRAAVVGFLRSPWAGVSDVRLAAHRRAGGGFDPRRPGEEGEPEVVAWLRLLAEARRELEHRDPAALLDLLRRRSGLEAVLEAAGDLQALANVRKLAEWARQARAVGDGVRFVAWLWARLLADEDEPEAPVPEGSGRQAVHLVTVHRAKGLEWPAVVVANWMPPPPPREGWLVDRASGRVEARLGGLATAGFARVRASEAERLEAERIRLLYVALTRARDYLLLLDYKPEGTPFACWPAVPEGFRGEPAPVPPAAQALPPPVAGPAVAPAATPIWIPAPAVQTPSRQGGGGAGEREPGGGLEVGRAYHAALRRHFNGRREDLPGGAAGELVRRTLAHPVLGRLVPGQAWDPGDPAGSRILALYPEYPLAGSVHGTAWMGQADLVVRTAGGWIVVEYKTDFVGLGFARDPGPELEAHAAQLRAYGALLEAAGLPAPRLWLYFAYPGRLFERQTGGWRELPPAAAGTEPPSASIS